ncbi:MAG: NAD(P)H-dependent oxidoreductase subunit E [Rhodobacteraceae bacterium]|nr:NAD(P)H-dependent oxidoreductase subunit E [Paracoccaceae bacterium]
MTTDRNIASITAEMADEVKEVAKRYPSKRSAIMPALYLAQDKYGTVDEVVYQAISEMLDVPEIWVFEVASFYSMYNRKELGKYHIQFCTNVSCMLLGADEVLANIKNRLGIETGETTDDRLFTLSSVECIGACDVAPVMIVNEKYYNNLTDGRVAEILDQLENDIEEVAG